MTIAFYKVNNSLGYGRHEFDTNRPETIMEKLSLLPDDEVKFYDAESYGWNTKNPSLADFEEDYNDEELDGGWWCIVLNTSKTPQTLEDMVSAYAYNEIKTKIQKSVGSAFDYVFPAVKKAIEEGSGDVRREILIGWLDCNSLRVCSYCGKIMEEGWYLCDNGYACSDECAAESEGITMDEFKRYRIYKQDIIDYLSEHGDSRKIEDLSDDECQKIIDEVWPCRDYCYTEWY